MVPCSPPFTRMQTDETFDFDSWSEISILKKSESIRTVSKIIKIPRVIIILRYDKVPNKEVKFNTLQFFKFIIDNSIFKYSSVPAPDKVLHSYHYITSGALSTQKDSNMNATNGSMNQTPHRGQ